MKWKIEDAFRRDVFRDWNAALGDIQAIADESWVQGFLDVLDRVAAPKSLSRGFFEGIEDKQKREAFLMKKLREFGDRLPRLVDEENMVGKRSIEQIPQAPRFLYEHLVECGELEFYSGEIADAETVRSQPFIGPGRAIKMLAAVTASLGSPEALREVWRGPIAETFDHLLRAGIEDRVEHVRELCALVQHVLTSSLVPAPLPEVLRFLAAVRGYLEGYRHQEESPIALAKGIDAIAQIVVAAGREQHNLHLSSYYYHEVFQGFWAEWNSRGPHPVMDDTEADDQKFLGISLMNASNGMGRLFQLERKDPTPSQQVVRHHVATMGICLMLAKERRSLQNRREAADAEASQLSQQAQLLKSLIGPIRNKEEFEYEIDALALDIMNRGSTTWKIDGESTSYKETMERLRSQKPEEISGSTDDIHLSVASHLEMSFFEACGAVCRLGFTESEANQNAASSFFNAGVELLRGKNAGTFRATELAVVTRLRVVVNALGLWWALHFGESEIERALTVGDGLDCAVNLFGALTDAQGNWPKEAASTIANFVFAFRGRLPGTEADFFRLGNSLRELGLTRIEASDALRPQAVKALEDLIRWFAVAKVKSRRSRQRNATEKAQQDEARTLFIDKSSTANIIKRMYGELARKTPKPRKGQQSRKSTKARQEQNARGASKRRQASSETYGLSDLQKFVRTRVGYIAGGIEKAVQQFLDGYGLYYHDGILVRSGLVSPNEWEQIKRNAIDTSFGSLGDLLRSDRAEWLFRY